MLIDINYIKGAININTFLCGETMTVGELIEILQQFDKEREVFLRNDNGYTFGSINESDFNGGAYDDDWVYLDDDLE